MKKDKMPGIIRPKRRSGESRWQRFWRKRRMNSIRNSSDHAVSMALGLFAIILIIATVAFLGLRGVKIEGAGPKPLNSWVK